MKRECLVRIKQTNNLITIDNYGFIQNPSDFFEICILQKADQQAPKYCIVNEKLFNSIKKYIK